MRWIYQLGDGYMLGYDLSSVTKVYTGYPYPDIDEPQFDRLMRFCKCIGISGSYDDFKRDLKSLISDINIILDKFNGKIDYYDFSRLLLLKRNGIARNKVTNSNSYFFFGSTNFYDIFCCHPTKFIRNLISSHGLDGSYLLELNLFKENKNYSDITFLDSCKLESDIGLAILVSHKIKDNFSTVFNSDTAKKMSDNDFKKFFHINFIPDFNSLFKDNDDKLILLTTKQIANLQSTVINSDYFYCRLYKYINIYCKEFYKYRLSDFELSILANDCHLDNLMYGSLEDYNNSFGTIFYEYMMDICKSALYTKLNAYHISSEEIIINMLNNNKIGIPLGDLACILSADTFNKLLKWNFKHLDNISLQFEKDTIIGINEFSLFLNFNIYFIKYCYKDYQNFVIECLGTSHNHNFSSFDEVFSNKSLKTLFEGNDELLRKLSKYILLGNISSNNAIILINLPKDYDYLGLICGLRGCAKVLKDNVVRLKRCNLEAWLSGVSLDKIREILLKIKDKLDLFVVTAYLESKDLVNNSIEITDIEVPSYDIVKLHYKLLDN